MTTAFSDVFLDMLNTANTRSVIPLEEDSTTICSALLILHGKKPAYNLDALLCRNLLRLGDKYNFLHIRAYVSLQARECLHSGGEAWEVLKVAIQLDDLQLIEESLSLLSIKEPPTQWEYSRVEHLGLRYYSAIVRAFDKSIRNPFEPYSRNINNPNWKEIRRHFRA